MPWRFCYWVCQPAYCVQAAHGILAVIAAARARFTLEAITQGEANFIVTIAAVLTIDDEFLRAV